MVDKKEDYLKFLVDHITDSFFSNLPSILDEDFGRATGVVDRDVRAVVYNTSSALIGTETRLSEMMDTRYGELKGFRVVTDDD